MLTNNQNKLKAKSRILPELLLSSVLFVGGCAFNSSVTPVDYYKTSITERGLVDAYNQDAENHFKNRDYTSAWNNYVITGNVNGLEIILGEYFKDALTRDKITMGGVNEDLIIMHKELRKKNSQLKGFDDNVMHQARIYEEFQSRSQYSLEKAFILYEIIERHNDAERCLTLWINEKGNNHFSIKRIMRHYKRFSKEVGFGNFRGESVKKAYDYLSTAPDKVDDCESAWIIGEALDDIEIKKKAVESGILHGRGSAWNDRAIRVQEILNRGK